MVEIAISVAAKIAEYLVAPVARPFSYLWNYKTNLENLKNGVKKLEAKREAVQHSVEDARRNCEEIEKNVESWLEDVTKIIDEASEVGEDNHQQASMQCFKGFSCTNLMKRYQHSKKAAKLKAVVEVQEEACKFEKVSYRIIPEQRCLQPSTGYQTFESRMSILKDIIHALSDSEVNMVGIYGMCGVGKTTLAKEVAREAGPNNGLSLFDKIIFVEVSESPDIINIQGVVAENLGLQFTEETVSRRAEKLRDRLKKEEKILLILDNIWGRIDFEKLGIPIENDRRGLKLLLTTRSRDVLINQMDSQCNFEVDALKEADAWSLFQSITGTIIDDPNLKSIACEVVEECGGMPVAIVAIAKALKGQGQNEWSNALEELKNPSWKSSEGIANGVYTSIKLSYDYLENEELKETFLLCSRMGHTYNASIQDLFRYGLGLGLFENFNTLEDALCNVYVSVNKLKAASLLLDVPKSESVFDPPTSERFAMNDIICDVAKSIANACTVIDVAIPQFWTNGNTLINCTSITLHNIDELPEDLELVCPQLRLFYVKLKDSSLRIPDNFFTRMLGIRVLHLIGINLRPLPTSINCLLDLQTLCIDRCELGDITFIGSLKKLKILSFCGSDIVELPKEMRRLTKLRLLDLTDCSRLRVIPPNVMSNFKKLEALYIGNTSIQWEVERPNIERSNVSIDELKHLRYLTMLEIHIPDAKMSKGLLYQKLEKYKIFIGHKWNAWHWRPHSKTSRMLKLSLNTKEDENIFLYLKGIEELELGEVPGATNLFDALDSNGFPTLKHLNVDSNSHCSYIVESSDALPLLESLDVGEMKVLEKICNRSLGANSFLQLRTIRVKKCHKLNNIFSSSAVTILPQLEEIEVSSCKNMEEIFAIGGQDDANNTEVVHEIKFSQLRILRLEYLSWLKSFCSNVKTDSPLQLTSDTQPREIISEEEMDICTLLFNEKVAFPNLQTLRISYIHVEKIWHNLPPKISSCVQNLIELSISGCGNLKKLFSSSTAVTEESRVEEMRDTILFPKLSYLRIENLEKLTTLWSGYYIEFPTLKEFQIESCPRLDAFIFDDKVRVPSLEIMEIRYMHNLKMISHNQLDGDSFSKLKSLEVEECYKLLTLFPSNICGRLLSLQYLDVRECQSLEYLFDASNNVANDDYSPKFLFSKLTSLVLSILPELRSFYPGTHTVEGPVLKTLKLWDCFIHDTDEEGQMQMQLPLFFVEQAFPCLEQLRLVGKNVKMMRQGQVLESLFDKLKILEVEDDDSAGLPLCFIQRFQNLEKLSFSFSSYKEIFLIGEDQTQAATPARIKTLHLSELDNLKYMWKQNFKLDLILQNLEALNIWNCDSLINVMPPSASFQNLTIMEVLSCSSLINIGTSSAAKSLVQLTQMTIRSCKNITEVVGNHGDVTEDEIIFPKLKSLSLKYLPSLTSFCFWNVTLQFPSLEELIVDDCPNMKIFSGGVLTTHTLREFKIDGGSIELCPDVDINKAIQQFHEKKNDKNMQRLKKYNELEKAKQQLDEEAVACSNLQTLYISDIHVEKIWHSLPPKISSCVQNLTELSIFRCGNLKELFSSSTVVTEESREEEMRDTILFPKLNCLWIRKLEKLTTLWSGYHIKFPTLKEFRIEDCPQLDAFIFDDKVACPNLQTLHISRIPVEKIWHNLPPKISSCVQNLTKLSIFRCGNLKELFSSSTVVTEESREEEMRDTILFPKLNRLYMSGLEKLTTLWSGYYIEFPTLKEFRILSCPQLDAFIFDDKVRVPSLEIMKIYCMDNLKMIWHNSQLDGDSFSKLKSLEVIDCPKLLTLFPSNICGRLLSLQELKVYRCQSLKYLFAASNTVANDEYSPKFLFPKLTSMELCTLPKLRSFYPGRHTVEGPVLKTLRLFDCFIHDTDEEGQTQMQQPLFFVEQAFPCLEELILHGKNIMMMWQGQVPESLFVKLKILVVRYDDDSTNLPLCIIQRFQNLEKLSLAFSSYKEIFSNGEDQTQIATPARIKTLYLYELKDLKYMWKHDFKLDLILQNLEVLRIKGCNSLINVMPPSASFQNLTVMKVKSCSSLINIGTSSAAKSLVQLTQMKIVSCSKITQVVGNHEDVTEDEIIFPKLKSLSLEDLPSFTSFCSWNVTLQFPSLEELFVDKCPQMKIFSRGVLTTQTLREIKIDKGSIELRPDVDINKAIQQFYEKVNDSEDYDLEDYSDSSKSLEMLQEDNELNKVTQQSDEEADVQSSNKDCEGSSSRHLKRCATV